MESDQKTMYEFILNKKTLEYTSANMAFYAFRGEKNMYSMLEHHLVGSAKETLLKAIEKEDYSSTFVMDFMDKDENCIIMAFRLVKQRSADTVGVRMLELDRLFDGFSAYQLSERESDALLAQYSTTYYFFDCATGSVTCMKYGIGKEVLGCVSPEELCTELNKRISEDCSDTVSKFVSDIKNGTRNFFYSVKASDEDRLMHLTGTSIYNGDVHIKTVGRIGGPSSAMLTELARCDQLTGLFLKETITDYARRRVDELKLPTVIAIVDIDDFKNVNDVFGHSKGDEVLKKCASIIAAQCEGTGKAGRIGGDEFLLVFDNFKDIDQLKNVLRGIKQTVFDTYNDAIDGFHVSTSIGVGAYPSDLDGDYDTLFRFADCLLYRAKHKGKNRYIVYKQEKHGSVEDVLNMGVKKAGLGGGRGVEKSELVCRIANTALSGASYPVDNILEDITNYFGVERIVIYNKTDSSMVTQFGKKAIDKIKLRDTIDYIFSESLANEFENGILVVNNVKFFAEKDKELYEKLVAQDIVSLMQHIVIGRDGKTYIISYEAVSDIIVWSTADMHYYRILSQSIGKYLI